jgi:hypothetical protein
MGSQGVSHRVFTSSLISLTAPSPQALGDATGLHVPKANAATGKASKVVEESTRTASKAADKAQVRATTHNPSILHE